MYAASPFALVQLASQSGAVQWIGYDQDARTGTTWQALNALPTVAGTTSGPGGSSTGGSATGGNSTTGNSTSVGGKGNNTAGAEAGDEGSAVALGARTVVAGVVAGFVGLASFAL